MKPSEVPPTRPITRRNAPRKTSPWNTLEIAKLGASLLTPIAVAVLGIVINTSVKDAERSATLRAEIYKTIGSDLNQIYSYLVFVGNWKEKKPNEIIESKRTVDKAMYTYKPFFSAELFDAYNDFMEEAFGTYRGAGTDAKLRSGVSLGTGDRALHSPDPWNRAVWCDKFTFEDNRVAQRQAYELFLWRLAHDLDLPTATGAPKFAARSKVGPVTDSDFQARLEAVAKAKAQAGAEACKKSIGIS